MENKEMNNKELSIKNKERHDKHFSLDSELLEFADKLYKLGTELENCSYKFLIIEDEVAGIDDYDSKSFNEIEYFLDKARCSFDELLDNLYSASDLVDEAYNNNVSLEDYYDELEEDF